MRRALPAVLTDYGTELADEGAVAALLGERGRRDEADPLPP